MEKILKKWGNSLVITLDSEDQQIKDLKEGDRIKIFIEKIESESKDNQIQILKEVINNSQEVSKQILDKMNILTEKLKDKKIIPKDFSMEEKQ